jgi:hypothetical protein
VLREAGIETSPVHRRNDTYTVFREFAAHLPGTDAFDADHACIPIGWWLSEHDVNRIIHAVHHFEDECRPRAIPLGSACAPSGQELL